MSMIKIENLTFAYPGSGENIFENVSFQIDTDWRLGFVGRNGRGKTTFLNILMGKYEYSGKVTGSAEFEYFPYSVKDPDRKAVDVIAEISPLAQDWEIIRETAYLELEDHALYRPFSGLSNGEQAKMMLAALFLNDSRFLLIDEPTNHLDAAGRRLVSDYLRKKKGFILVSHDRRFLDNCTDHILSLNRADIEVRNGNFSSWFENFSSRQESELRQNERLEKDIDRLRRSAGQTSAWSDKIERSKKGAADKGYVGHRAAKMMKRSKAAEQRQLNAAERKAGLLKNTETAEKLKLSPIKYRSEVLVSFKDVFLYRGGRRVCGPVSFELRRGDRIALNGKNGSGKSTILGLICGENIEHTGEASVGSGLVISHVPQSTGHLRGGLSAYAEKERIDESLFKAILRKMDFKREHFEKDMSEFSEGQKKKVMIAGSLCRSAHLYVWDEPMNFIDIYSRMQIERLIEEFAPTMVFVEHDDEFRKRAAVREITIG